MRRSSIAFAAGLAAVLAAAWGTAWLVPSVRASDDTLLYLTWHAPYGTPGATTDLAAAWGDTTSEDTLYLTCDVGTDSESFNGFMATLLLHAQIGDTLAPHWRFGHGMHDLKNVRPLWSTDSIPGARVPWMGLGGKKSVGAIHYDYSSGTGTLKMTFAVGAGFSKPLKFGDRYCLARLLFRRPSADEADARRPICIEWATSTLSFWFGFDPVVTRGARFVTWNSPDGQVCEPFRAPLRVRAWKPASAPPAVLPGH